MTVAAEIFAALPARSLGYGAAGLGNLYREVSDAEATAVVEAAWAGGVRYYDTAPHYGLGLSERRLGAALARYPREQLVLSTKVGRLLEPDPDRAGETDDAGFAVPAAYRRVWDPSPEGVHRSLAESRTRLGVDRIDIALLHDPDAYDLEDGIARGLPALAAEKRAGAVRAIGVGSTSVEALAAAVRTGLCDLIMVAGRLTLLDRSGWDLLELCRRHDVAIIDVGVFNSGALAADRPGPGLRFDYAPIEDDRLAQVERIHAVCARFDIRVADAALQFAGRLPGVVNVTVGALSATELRQSLAGVRTPIDPALWPALEEALGGAIGSTG